VGHRLELSQWRLAPLAWLKYHWDNGEVASLNPLQSSIQLTLVTVIGRNVIGACAGQEDVGTFERCFDRLVYFGPCVDLTVIPLGDCAISLQLDQVFVEALQKRLIYMRVGDE
jgi:hypothetical protein